MSGNDIDEWAKRFRALDAQEEEEIDDSAHYRSLLQRDAASTGTRSAKARRPEDVPSR